MKTFEYQIELLSDAQLGTGLGSELINDFVPRDHLNRPMCPASHIKGLMREALFEIFENLNWNLKVLDSVLGTSFEKGNLDAESCFQITDAVIQVPSNEKTPYAPEKSQTILVSRTALNEWGSVKEMSLRTNEAIRVGTVFHGKILSRSPEDSLETKVWQLGLLSVFAVGGSRSRGCGQCRIQLKECTKKPSELIHEICDLLKNWKPASLSSETAEEVLENSPAWSDSDFVPVRLTFRAETPVCVPATAAAKKANLQKTDFSIPASAVRGMLIRRLASEKYVRTSNLFASLKFLSWPLQPCAVVGEDDLGKLPIGIRVSLTHRAAKFSLAEELFRQFEDESIDGDVRSLAEAPPKAPMKASDGVLLVPSEELPGKNGPKLWKAGDMPHDIRSHGVHRNSEGQNERNLYSVDSMAPLVWRGLAVLPREAAQLLAHSFQKLPEVSFGTRRRVQGMGHLEFEILEGIPVEWRANPEISQTVLIVQSPISIPQRFLAEFSAEAKLQKFGKMSADSIFLRMAEEYLQTLGIESAGLKTWANAGLLFGWNIKGAGLQPPRFVILPGSVLQFQEKIPEGKLLQLLKGGFFLDDQDPQRGYGAVSVHPGKAKEFYKRGTELPQFKNSPQFLENIQLVLEIAEKHLPSPSQISGLRAQVAVGDWKTYFKNQIKRDRTWEDWNPIQSEVKELLEKSSKENQLAALDFLIDLAIVKNMEKTRKN